MTLDYFVESSSWPITIPNDGQETLNTPVGVVTAWELDGFLRNFLGCYLYCRSRLQARCLVFEFQPKKGGIKASVAIGAFSDCICGKRLFAVCTSKELVELVHVVLARLDATNTKEVGTSIVAFKPTNQVGGDRGGCGSCLR